MILRLNARGPRLVATAAVAGLALSVMVAAVRGGWGGLLATTGARNLRDAVLNVLELVVGSEYAAVAFEYSPTFAVGTLVTVGLIRGRRTATPETPAVAWWYVVVLLWAFQGHRRLYLWCYGLMHYGVGLGYMDDLPRAAKHHYTALVPILALLALTVMIRPPSDDQRSYLKSIIVAILVATFDWVLILHSLRS